MTINELHIQFDLQPENRIDILEDASKRCDEGYLFVDSNNGHCYLFDEDGNKDDVKKLKKIDNKLFYNSNISSIIIPDSVKWIGYGAFSHCKSLESIIIPNSVESIRDYAFWCCKSLESIIIPNSIRSIGNCAFVECKSLKSLIFKGKTIDQIKEIGWYPFGIEDESIIKCA